MTNLGVPVGSRDGSRFFAGLAQALSSLDPSPATIGMVMLPSDGGLKEYQSLWTRDGVAAELHDSIEVLVAERVTADQALGDLKDVAPSDMSLWAQAIVLDSGDVVGALVVARDDVAPWTDTDVSIIELFATICGSAWSYESHEAYRTSLDNLIVEVANRLMPASDANVQEILDWTCEALATFLGADVSFLRYNDHKAGTSNLMAEYPKRVDIPDPDPLGIVPFDIDPMFEMTRDLKEPIVGATTQFPENYRDRVAEARSDLPFSGAAVPLMDGDVTTGVLAFIYMEERAWMQSEINALQAVASLLSQMNGRVAAERQLRYNASHDGLTGLHNRRSLLVEIDRRLSSEDAELALLFMDLDRFKIMNDYMGHHVGDRILVASADRIRTSLRPGDFAARLGGDEFVILLEKESDNFGAVATANRMLNLIAQPVEVNGKSVSHTCSIGVAISDMTVTTSEQLLTNADVALYEAKHLGGNQAVVFDHALSAASDERSNTELGLRSAIADGDLRLHYQPEFDLVTGEVLAVEALIRWQHPERGRLLAAGEFILVAEETGLIVDLGRWILDEACRTLAILERRQHGTPFQMRINTSPAELSVPGYLAHVRQTIRRSGVNPEHLCFEITEHAFIGDMTQTIETLNGLRSLGINLAIDDFGTGFSSLTQLKELPFNVMKIDGSFVNGIAESTINQAIVQASISLATAFGLDVVAEGIEHHEEIDYLVSIGCHRAQGYLLARPMAFDSLTVLLDKGPIDLNALVALT